MPRIVTVAIAQLGPIARGESRQEVVARLLALMETAARMGSDVIVYPEAALTAFFPHWLVEDEAELDGYFEPAMPGPAVRPLFDAARRLRIGFHLGYAELAYEAGRKRRFNTAILVGRDGAVIGKYRKIHLPGHVEPRPGAPFQNLEKRHFEVGDLGFPVWEAFGGRIVRARRVMHGADAAVREDARIEPSRRHRVLLVPKANRVLVHGWTFQALEV